MVKCEDFYGACQQHTVSRHNHRRHAYEHLVLITKGWDWTCPLTTLSPLSVVVPDVFEPKAEINVVCERRSIRPSEVQH